MKFKIEHNVPQPGPKYPFAKMKPGDSFFFAGKENRTKISNAAINYGKHHGMKFMVRKIERGYRCWRIK